ncbi:MAG TPA: alpha-amylase family protein [Cyclobacteriaceae bacterium]
MTRLFGNKIQVNKPYGTLKENGVGKFADISERALSEIKAMGITHVWYTGVIEHAGLTDYTAFGIPLDDADVVKGRAGSPYAIKDYYDVNPDLAIDVTKRVEEFEALVNRTHKQELKVIIDFVPNHVARSYRSDAKPEGILDLGEGDDKSVRFSVSNNFYYLLGESFRVPPDYVALGNDNDFPTKDGKFEETPAKATGNDKFSASPNINDWFETVKLNYGVDIENGRKYYFDPIPNTWVKMKDILVYWAGKKVDGFRCDMAEMVPVEFWQWAIPQVKEVNPEIIFIAEIYNPQAYHSYVDSGRFDFLYDKVQLYDTLRTLISGGGNTNDIKTIRESLVGLNANMLHFLENHDEQRIASPFFAGDPHKAKPAMLISATIDQGPMMIYFGQEVGEPGMGAEGFQGDDGRTTVYDYWGVPEHQKWMSGGAFDGALLSESQKELRNFYVTLLNLAQTNEAIVQGDYIDLTQKNIEIGFIDSNIVLFLRSTPGEKLLIMAGFNDQSKSIKIRIPKNVMDQIQMSVSSDYELEDLLSRKKNWLSKGESTVELPAYGACVFRIKKWNHDL